MKRFTIGVMEYAAYTRRSVVVMAETAAEACDKARTRVEAGKAGDGLFEHWDGNRPFAYTVNGEDGVPFPHGEIAVNHPAVVRLVEAVTLSLPSLSTESTAAVRLRLAMADLMCGDEPSDITVPSDPQAGLAHELRILRRLIGTTSAQGLAEARGIAERAADQTERLRKMIGDLIDLRDEIPLAATEGEMQILNGAAALLAETAGLGSRSAT